MLTRSLLTVVVLTWPCAAGAATLRPAAAETFFVTPDEPAVLRWHVESGGLEAPVEGTVRDYWDTPIATTPAKITPDGHLELTVELAPGFYAVEFPATNQRFGVMSLAAYEGQKDPFFSIDAAMSWLVRGDEVRQSLIKVLQRSGVAMSRERLNWAQISPTEREWDWESPMHYETIRQAYAKCGVDVLEMFHNTTRWAGSVGKYPDDLVGTARSWGQIGRRWRPTWGAMEVWNEPDISFGAFLPADQYVPLVSTIAYGFARAEVDVPIVGGVFAHYNRQFLDNAARNGLVDSVDVVSFHTYGRAPGMETLIGNYRSWLEAHDREAMPLWITECGRPWKRGPDVPPTEQDAESALDIIMKAVESRACGIARYFAFVYPFYEERDNNFGMMGRNATPLRSMAAYARLAAILAHKRYLGDLRCDDDAIQRARLFGDDRETIAVLYTGRPDATAKLKLDLPVQKVEGIDGRLLEAAEQGTVPVPDGLVYVWLDRNRLGDRLQPHTSAMRLWSIGLQEPPRPGKPSPIVLRYQFDTDVVQPTSNGYRIKAEQPGETALVVRVFNLCDQRRDLSLELSFSQAAARVLGPATRPVNVPGEGSVDVTWQADLSGSFAAADRLKAEVRALDEKSKRITALHVDLIRQEKDAKQ